MFNAPLHVNIAQKSTVETHFQILLRQYTRISRQRYCNPEIHEYNKKCNHDSTINRKECGNYVMFKANL